MDQSRLLRRAVSAAVWLRSVLSLPDRLAGAVQHHPRPVLESRGPVPDHGGVHDRDGIFRRSHRLKGFHVRLWDYSKQWGNIQGLICPKFSLAWALLGAAYYFLIHPRILHAIDWLSRNLAFSFVIGLFYGVFLIDVVYSTKLIHRIKKLADENEVIVRYENLKAHVRSVHDRSAQKASFFFPLRSERPLNEHLRELRETLEQRRRTGGKKHAG